VRRRRRRRYNFNIDGYGVDFTFDVLDFWSKQVHLTSLHNCARMVMAWQASSVPSESSASVAKRVQLGKAGLSVRMHIRRTFIAANVEDSEEAARAIVKRILERRAAAQGAR
jgi:hypothetical protein